MIECALFPLSQVLLPEGRMRLRIFEPRYQRLVREAAAGTRPFASALLNPYVSATHEQRIFPVVTLVDICDFETLDDGLLGITIVGRQRAQITKRWQESDKLHVAHCEPLAAWPASHAIAPHAKLQTELQQIFADNPELASLYQQPPWHDQTWCAQRWLELLSMPPALRHEFMAADSATPTIEALDEWLTNQEQPN